MARRKANRNTRRRRKSAFNVTNAAQTLIIANAMVKGATNANLVQFFTGTSMKDGSMRYAPGADGSLYLTLPELFGAGPGGIGGNYSGDLTLTKVLETNVRANFGQMLGTAILVPVAFKLGKKVLGKPLINPMNRTMRSLGITEVKV